ncbi:hypothetical protein [Rhodanobacter sp. OR87]|uniref:hypothetical protein n=2 Tax=Rhodanobacteraceae TaxID=1775411 RepID=UPI001E2A3020|nr:hypothetical protein [Rhodanobacter sp. OR87]
MDARKLRSLQPCLLPEWSIRDASSLPFVCPAPAARSGQPEGGRLMSPAVRNDPAPARRFAAWAVGPWVLLLFAALGFVQYLRHAEYLYLAAALLVIVACAGCILRQAWARPVLQLLAVLLAAWALVTAALMLQQAGDFDTARQHALAQPQLGEVALWMIARAERIWQVGLALKAAAIPLLLWLAWQLGRSTVRAQFRPRRRGRL